jgi:hypothetical protein
MKRILLICMTFNIRKKVCGLFLFEEIWWKKGTWYVSFIPRPKSLKVST